MSTKQKQDMSDLEYLDEMRVLAASGDEEAQQYLADRTNAEANEAAIQSQLDDPYFEPPDSLALRFK